MNTRIQLTLFIDENHSAVIEDIRKKFNPVQYELIKSHVTLCREDELGPIETVISALAALEHHCVTINFGPVIKFSEEKGVLIPATGGNQLFQKLRAAVLQKAISDIKKHEPHITLLHPRNAVCTNEIFEQIKKMRVPQYLTFTKISLIEQHGAGKWQVVKEFELIKNN